MCNVYHISEGIHDKQMIAYYVILLPVLQVLGFCYIFLQEDHITVTSASWNGFLPKHSASVTFPILPPALA